MINKAKLIPILFIAPLFLMGTKISNSDKNHVLYNDYEIVNFALSDLDENNYRTLTFDINNTGEGIITLQQSYMLLFVCFLNRRGINKKLNENNF